MGRSRKARGTRGGISKSAEQCGDSARLPFESRSRLRRQRNHGSFYPPPSKPIQFRRQPPATRIFNGGIVVEGQQGHGRAALWRRPYVLPSRPGAFVYKEVQINVPFEQAQPGILGKTWLAGLGTNTLGGIYAFDSVENAVRFSNEYFPTEARAFNVAFTARVFDAAWVEEASREMGSPFFA
ncbi:hypothetical protein DFJ74DRAFT_685540 [Hyaloraphidium curvatum]|nr:hypothetical protein DFJ74DRAFT_685540 [Hyaloraphidium curvatum]